MARLAPDATIETAREDLDQVSRTIFPQWADGFRDQTARLTPYSLKEYVVGDVGANLWLLLGAVLGVLLIAVSNVSNLLLVRASSREPEMALRSSIGATGFQLGRQLVTESALLSAIGGVVAVFLAWGGLELLVALGPNLPRLGEVRLDLRVLAVAGGITALAAVAFGTAPLTQAAPPALSSVLGGRHRSTKAGRSAGVFRSSLVVLEFAIAFPLLAGALLMGNSLAELGQVDPGFDPEGLVSATLSLPEGHLSRLPVDPAVLGRSAATGQRAAHSDGGRGGKPRCLRMEAVTRTTSTWSGRPVDTGQSEPVSLWSWTTPGYLAALGVPLVRGRTLESSDDGTAGPVAVVSESWAARHVTEGEVLGTQFYSGGDRSVAMTVVGVVGDVKLTGLATDSDAAVYEPFTQITWRRVHLLVRARGALDDALSGVRTVISVLDPTLPISNVQTMSTRMDNALSQPRRWTVLLGLFSGLGLVLSAVGAYGVLSFYVGQQTRNLGIRLALGADPKELRRRVILRGLGLAGAGLMIGAVMSLGRPDGSRVWSLGFHPRTQRSWRRWQWCSWRWRS